MLSVYPMGDMAAGALPPGGVAQPQLFIRGAPLVAAHCRPFSSGSRQPPDPIDQFLAQVGFYRKHTARDSTSLYRCVSEQLFDTQNYHEHVRQECIRYMRRQRERFEPSVDRDFDQYLDDLSKPRAHGTLLELRALAHLFGRNVLLFEPYNTGTWLVHPAVDVCGSCTSSSSCSSCILYPGCYAADLLPVRAGPDEAHHSRCLKLFHTCDGHFDSVFDQSFIEDAAFCQSLCYEIMYSCVFRLPDVMYAVEHMLHHSAPAPAASCCADGAPSSALVSAAAAAAADEYGGKPTVVAYPTMHADGYPERMMLADGRVFLLDRPDVTRCVLENYRMCGFHNWRSFDEVTRALRRDLAASREPQQETRALRQLQALLPDRYTSCVRQLLDEGITPFPYKVAKSLDPSIYRNVEYDTWSEYRKEQRMRYMQIGQYLQIGAKCHVRLHASQATPYVCHIQEMRPHSGKCYVFIEELGEKRFVAMSALVSLDAPSTQLQHPQQHHRNQQQQQQPFNGTANRQQQPNRTGQSALTNHGNHSKPGDHRRLTQASASAPVAAKTNSRTTATSTTTISTATSASAASASSSAWVHNKTASGSGWLSNGGRRYGFTKNTCNQNKTTLLQPQPLHEQRGKLGGGGGTKPTHTKPGSLIGDSLSRYVATTTTSVERAKLFDDDDDDACAGDAHAGKLMQFNGFCSDAILGESQARAVLQHVYGGEEFLCDKELSLQLQHLTSTVHFEPAPFETIAAPFIVASGVNGGGGGGGANNGGSYRSMGNGKQQQQHHQAYKSGGKKKGMLANPPDSAKTAPQQAPNSASKAPNTSTDSGSTASTLDSSASAAGDHSQHDHHTATAIDSKDSMFTGYNPFATSAAAIGPPPYPMICYVDSPWNYDTTQMPPPPSQSQPATNTTASLSHLPPPPGYADHHRGHPPLVASASSAAAAPLPIGYGIGGRGSAADRSRFPPPPYDLTAASSGGVGGGGGGGGFISFGDVDVGAAGGWTTAVAPTIGGTYYTTAAQPPYYADAHLQSHMYTATAAFPAPPPPPPQQQQPQSLLGAPNGGAAPQPLSSNVLAIPLRHRELLEQLTHVDLDAQPSYDPRGYDIGTSDVGTLRFFYNLGHEFYRQLRNQFTGQALAQLTRSPAAAAADETSTGQDVSDAISSKMGKMRLGGKLPLTKGGHNGDGSASSFGRRFGGARNATAQRAGGGGAGGRSAYTRSSPADERPKGGLGADAKQTPTTHHHSGKHDGHHNGSHQHYYSHHADHHAGEMFSTPRYSGQNGHGQHNSSGGSGHGVPLLSTPLSFNGFSSGGGGSHSTGAATAEMASSIAASGQYVSVPSVAATAPPPPPPPMYVPYYAIDDQQYYYDPQMYMQMPYGLYPPGYAYTTGPYVPQPYALPMPLPHQPPHLPAATALGVSAAGDPPSSQPPPAPSSSESSVCIDVVNPSSTPVLAAEPTELQPPSSATTPLPTVASATDEYATPTDASAASAQVITILTPGGDASSGVPTYQQQPMHHPAAMPMASYFYGPPQPAPVGAPIAMAPQGYWYPPPTVIPISPSMHSPCHDQNHLAMQSHPHPLAMTPMHHPDLLHPVHHLMQPPPPAAPLHTPHYVSDPSPTPPNGHEDPQQQHTTTDANGQPTIRITIQT